MTIIPKLSIVIAYYNRKNLLLQTLMSMSKSSRTSDFEVVIVDDASSEDQRLEDIVKNYPFSINLIRQEQKDKNYINPCIPYNIGFKAAKGQVIIIQNPECFHVGDLISYALENISDNRYISFSTYALSKQDTALLGKQPIWASLKNIRSNGGQQDGWYNHSSINPRPLHFASCITKKNLDELGGFDESYKDGIGFDDDEFLLRVRKKKLHIEICDSPFVYHQNHYDNNSFEAQFAKSPALFTKNKELYLSLLKKSCKIIGFSQLHNELELGNLENWFKSMSFCDQIYIFDQASTDGSREYYKKFNNVHVILSDKNRFDEELLCKQELLSKLLLDHPDTDWVFWMDGDTLLDARLNRDKIEDILSYLDIQKVESAWLGHYNLWRSDVWHRVDDQYDHFMKAGRMAFWKNNRLLKFDTQQGLHKSQHPMGISNGVRLPFNLIHKGFADDTQIIKKYYNYKSRGQSGWALDRLLDERTLKVERVPDEELPNWCVSDKQSPLTKTSIKYIQESQL